MEGLSPSSRKELPFNQVYYILKCSGGLRDTIDLQTEQTYSNGILIGLSSVCLLGILEVE